jgi:hypothetical protein
MAKEHDLLSLYIRIINTMKIFVWQICFCVITYGDSRFRNSENQAEVKVRISRCTVFFFTVRKIFQLKNIN